MPFFPPDPNHFGLSAPTIEPPDQIRHLPPDQQFIGLLFLGLAGIEPTWNGKGDRDDNNVEIKIA